MGRTSKSSAGRPERATPIPLLLEQTAADRPGDTACCDPWTTLTYATLLGRVNHLSSRILAHGVGLEDRVGILTPHRSDLLVAVLAVLRAGGSFVPIDPSEPAARSAFIAADAELKLVVSDRAEPGLPDPVPVVVTGADVDRSCPGAFPARPDHLACIIYTSGSTGAPKGVMVTHRGLSNLAYAACDVLDLTARDRYLSLAPATFSASLEELFPPLLAGAASVFPPDRSGALSPVALLDLLDRESISVLELQTAPWHILMDYLRESGRVLPASVRTMIVGGERASTRAAAQWNRLGRPLVHVYGPTETTATATYHRVAAGQAPEDRPLPLGTAIAGTRTYLVDEELRPVAPGEAGELLVGGDALARGYLHRPAETAERFTPDHLSGTRGGRLYRTGDRVRALPEGGLQFLDRTDRQGKVRGHRVEPAELEAALDRHPAVRQSFAMVVDHPVRGGQLVAYVVADGAGCDAQALGAYLADRLPPQIVPAAIVRLDRLPLTSYGKVDRAALPVPEAPGGGEPAGDGGRDPAEGTAGDPAGDPVEAHTRGLAAALLGLDRVRSHDDLVALGGDSLFMLRLVGRLGGRYGVRISLRDAFTDRTAERIAARVVAQLPVSGGDRPVADHPRPDPDPPRSPPAMEP